MFSGVFASNLNVFGGDTDVSPASPHLYFFSYKMLKGFREDTEALFLLLKLIVLT